MKRSADERRAVELLEVLEAIRALPMDRERVILEVPGEPVAQPRPQVVSKDRRGRPLDRPRVYYPGKAVAGYRRRIKRAAEALGDLAGPGGWPSGEAPIARPAEIRIEAVWEAPASWPRWRRELLEELEGSGEIGIPRVGLSDWDNVAKVVCDSLEGILFHGDRQIVGGLVRRWWGSRARTLISVAYLPALPAIVGGARG